MKFADELNDENYLRYCAKYYRNPQCTDAGEFFDDIQRIKYIKKLITKYIMKDELNERLILNHIIILNNVFPPTVVCKLLFFKLYDQMQYIKPFLVLLNILPDVLYNVGNRKVINTDEIQMNQHIVNVLRINLSA